MLGWRKRNDGFEWREYVRTTILVRRKQRRDRISEAGKAAVENLKAAGQRGAAAGAEGAKAVGRGAVHAGQRGAVAGAAGAKAFGRGALHYGQEGARLGISGMRAAGTGLRAAVPLIRRYLQRFGAALIGALAYTWAVLRTLGGLAYDYLGPPLAPIGRLLRQPSLRLPLLIAGGVALLGGIIRAFANGFVSDTVIALAIGIGILGALALAHAQVGLPTRVAAPLSSIRGKLRGRLGTGAARPGVQVGAGVLALALLITGGIWAWQASSDGTKVVSRQARQETRQGSMGGDVTGRGSAVTGDVLRVGARLVRLNGIEAPEPDQMCADAGGRQWACGEAARQALGRLLRSGRVACEISDNGSLSSGDCRIDDTDVAAELVRGGHVFAVKGLFASYGGIEAEARAARAGLWAGEPVRPSDYRAEKWEEAKRDAPDGCPIKGNVRGGRRFYVVPWARGYATVKVSRSRGERWFCSETEAQEAGFEPAERS
jgi:endonuclease YncB( thermonuclease family)